MTRSKTAPRRDDSGLRRHRSLCRLVGVVSVTCTLPLVTGCAGFFPAIRIVIEPLDSTGGITLAGTMRRPAAAQPPMGAAPTSQWACPPPAATPTLPGCPAGTPCSPYQPTAGR
ncbi:MAG: hypothetical protein HY744_23400 [Deltaproteobacteria bacterium]|nr:hypothetical protein [Deltaproteobacteria bacterium]